MRLTSPTAVAALAFSLTLAASTGPALAQSQSRTEPPARPARETLRLADRAVRTADFLTEDARPRPGRTPTAPAAATVLPEPAPFPEPAPAPEPEPTPGPEGDPYGFAAVLNGYRAAAGLPPLAYDENLSNWASQNNAAQSHRGLGHFVNPNCSQNSAWNLADAGSVAQAWMNSPGHRENMLSPTATRFGIAYGPGPYWTMNAQ